MFAAAVVALLTDVRQPMAQTAFDVFRERSAMVAAGRRCKLFDAGLTAALTAGAVQARTGALRAGFTSEVLDRGAEDAEAIVARLACHSPRVQQSAERARQAFRAYGGLQRMSFPGDVAAWRADRTMPVHSASWRLSQETYAGQDRVVFGLAGRDGAEAVSLSVASPDGVGPYGALLVMRDSARLPQPLIKAGAHTLAERAPIRAVGRIFQAAARTDADPALRPRGARKAVAFRFPDEARETLRRLDPREAVTVELLYPSDRGDLIRTAFVEVGDFDAGLAFLNITAPPR